MSEKLLPKNINAGRMARLHCDLDARRQPNRGSEPYVVLARLQQEGPVADFPLRAQGGWPGRVSEGYCEAQVIKYLEILPRRPPHAARWRNW